MGAVSVLGVQINNNQSITGEIDLGNNTLFAIDIPSTWAGTALTFQSKTERVDKNGQEFWKDVYDDAGTEVSLTVAANRIVTIDTAALKLASLRYIRIRSGSSAAPVNQSPSKNLYLIVKK